MPYRVTPSARGDFPKAAGQPGRGADEDRRGKADLFGLLHDGQGVGIIAGPEEDVRFGFFGMPEHGAVVSAAQGRALERFSFNRGLFSAESSSPYTELGRP